MPEVNFLIQSNPPRVVARCHDEERELPALWLRERSQEPDHLDPLTQQRLFNPHTLPDDLALTAAEPAGASRAWLSFSDGYRGCYNLALFEDIFDDHDRLPQPEPWDSRLNRAEVSFHWPQLANENSMHCALERFLVRGFLILQGVPTDPQRILEVASTFGHLRETNFGAYFEVYSRPASNDLAYRTVALGPHTDNPYRSPVPGVQILHCLINEVQGGWSTLADSLAVGRTLATEDPEGFELLATTPVRFCFEDAEGDFIERRPIIRRDASGKMSGLHYSPRLDYMPLLDNRTQSIFHRARRRLGELLADPDNEIRFALRAGELIIFDNNRLVHGRTAFDASEGRRHLQGCYIDIDEPRSRYRVLSKRLLAIQLEQEAS